MRFRFLALTAVFLGSPVFAFGQSDRPAAEDDRGGVPLKPARTQLEAIELRDFSSLDASQPSTSGPQGAGRELRTLQGRLVDHLGKPIPGALISLQEEIGFQNPTALENCDKTDELGRFVVRGDLLKDRVEVRLNSEAIWNQVAEPDQTYMKFVWPKPSRLRLEIDLKMLLAGKEFTLTSADYRSDTAFLTMQRAQTHEGVTTFSLVPGKYRVNCPKRIKVGGFDVERSVEMAQFTIAEGEERTVRVLRKPEIAVTNSIANLGKDDPGQQRGAFVEIVALQQRYQEGTVTVDIAPLDAEGHFHAQVPRPGAYSLCVNQVAPPVGNQPRRGRNEPFDAQQGGSTRFVVKPGESEVDVSRLSDGDSKSPTVSNIHSVLASQGPPNVSYSHTDVQVAQLARDTDRAEVAAELLRILNDQYAPYEWIYPAMKTLGEMTDQEGVVEGLMALWDVPFRQFERGQILSALGNPQRKQPEVIDWLEKLSNDQKLRPRMSAYYALEQLAVKQPAYRARIAPILIRGLTDPYQDIRARSAGALGYIAAEQAAMPLRARLNDSDQVVRLTVAQAIWKLTGDREPLVQVGTDLLAHENLDLRSRAASQLESLDKLPAETLTALRANLVEQPAGPRRGRGRGRGVDVESMLRSQVSEAARRTLAKQGAAAEEK